MPLAALLFLSFAAAVDAGFCVDAPPGLGFCGEVVTYKVYVLKELSELPGNYFVGLDDQARLENLQMEEGMQCDGTACIEHICNKYFLKCNDELDAPLDPCYYSCYNCLSTCEGEPRLHRGWCADAGAFGSGFQAQWRFVASHASLFASRCLWLPHPFIMDHCLRMLALHAGAEIHPGLAYQCKAKKYTKDCKAMNAAPARLGAQTVAFATGIALLAAYALF